MGGARGVSPNSASDLSSPPHSSPEPSPSAQFANDLNVNNSNQNSSIIVNPPGAVGQSAEKPARRKPGRKPGSSNKPKTNETGSATNTDAPKQRRPRKPKDPNAPPTQRRKRNTASDVAIHPDIKVASDMRQPQPNEAPPNTFYVPPTNILASQNGKSDDIPRPIQSFFAPAPPPQPSPQQQTQSPAPHQTHPQPVRSSGQNYDPIRSNYDPVRETVISHSSYGNPQGSPGHPHSMNRASASPSISSLVDPPNHALTSPSIAAQSFFNQQQQARLHQVDGHASQPPSPSVSRLAPAVHVEPALSPNPPAVIPPPPTKKPEAMVSTHYGPSTISKKMGPGSASTSSAAASPKPHKAKESKEVYIAPPPLPGSGMMGIGGGGPSDGTESRAPTVILSIPMNGEVNKYINFTRLAEEQYGWDALHPRLAAQRDRLARVAAAGAALERIGSNNESGDEMSLDSEAEGEGSNVEMGGMSDGRTGTDGGAKRVPKKRKMKEDEYDKDDGFVDDTELLWEEHAAATNDGFFVYSGPLVPEGEKPAVETRFVLIFIMAFTKLTTFYRADGAPKRGRGRGSRGGRGGSTRGAHLGSIPLGRNGLPTSGPGSRGGSTTRKPRMTKADRARMEQEKAEREKMGTMASMPSSYGSMTPLAPSNLGSTPMVFNQ